jgi:hypothetical protein
MQNTNVRPIFVIGAPRSGTTLFQYMLRSHPRISMPTGESHFFVPMFRDESRFGDLTRVENVRSMLASIYSHPKRAEFFDTDLHGIDFDIDRLATESITEGRSTMQAVFAGIFEKNAAGEGKARWGDKTPYYVLHMPLLLERFPGAQFIHLIRDGRDVALSLLNRRHDFGVYNVYTAAKHWQIYVERGQQDGIALGEQHYHEVRYEDLLADPAAAMRRVCAFLGEEYSDSLIDFRKSGEAGKTPLLQKPIQGSNKEKWRTKMSTRQLAIFEGAVSKTLTRNGYALATPASPPSFPLRAWCRLHNAWFCRWQRLGLRR